MEKKSFAGIWLPGNDPQGVELAFRGHEVAEHPLNPERAVVIGRRPGRYLANLDLVANSLLQLRPMESYRTLNGHCAFSADGKSLYTSENDTSTGMGTIGVRHVDTLAKYAELPSYGVGPHGIILEESRKTLLIANGGVLGIPKPGIPQDRSGAVVQIDPSLVRIDIESGRLLSQWRLNDPYLSIRHLAGGPKSSIGVALQAAHPDEKSRSGAPVLALFDGEKSFKTVDAPPARELKGYGGDVACLTTGGKLLYAVGCTHADVISWWDDSGRWHGFSPLPSACAVGSTGEDIFAATELGRTVKISPNNMLIGDARTSGLAWENHVSARSSRPSYFIENESPTQTP